MSDKCPFCGAALQPWVSSKAEIKDYFCDTRTFIYEGSRPIIGDACYNRQIANLQEKIAELERRLVECDPYKLQA